MDVFRQFGSLSAFVDFAKGPSDMPTYRRSSRTKGNQEFTGTSSWEEATHLADGWQEGARRFAQQSVTLAPKGRKTRRTTAMREVGPGVLSMGNYLTGHPQPYVTLQETNRPRPGKGKIVRFLVNISASASVKTSVIERRGAAITALVATLERAGRRCEIVAVAVSHASNGGESIEYRIALKKSQEKVNLPSLAFALAHPSMFRRLVFSARECEGKDIRYKVGIGKGDGYGKSTDVKEVESGTIYLGAMRGRDSQWKSENAATEWVRSELKAQGIELK
ncbi:hypothetical protein [Alkalihalobacillus sp. TS-13]|uniref:DUF7192 family protein n=1 Tax=Alkalihalobacillus sp. TS-13 TaxID=2842455 RepID=UPI001C87F26F|nr:hypothetical protein [Alkalihalobacillus sp. TS-13]